MKCGRVVGPIIFVLGTILFNECLLHHLHVLVGCSWKDPDSALLGSNNTSPLRVLMIADTHLLGKYMGHWADKLKREWQMYQSFRAALWMNPDAIFFLGDLLDEGKWTDDELFHRYADEFHKLFNVDGLDTQLHVVAGNHDVGFHYEMYPQRMEWFRDSFNKSLVDAVRFKGHTFVLLNSMALHGDACMLCSEARRHITSLADDFNCLEDVSKCNKLQTRSKMVQQNGEYRRPIILQHFPLFRESELDCIRDEEFDSTELKRDELYRSQWDCLSNESTWYLIDQLHPRAVFNGHSHRGCKKSWPTVNLMEYTVNSFSWRNGDRPSFLAVSLHQDQVSVSTCYLPRESTTYLIYTINLIILFMYIVYSCFTFFYNTKNPSRDMYIPVHRKSSKFE